MANLALFATAAYQNLQTANASPRMASIVESSDDVSESKRLASAGKDPRSETSGPLIGTVAFSEFVMSQCGTAAQNAESTSAAQRHHRLARAVAYMAREPFRSHTVADLAAVAGMSRSSFAQCFTTTFGSPPIDYLKGERLRLAANLLSTTSLPVKLIAGRIGYDSVSYFSRSFNAAFGMPPSAVRAQSIRQRRPGDRVSETLQAHPN
jgi:AraC family transcriptional regulator, activator of mtrCDE